jgi:hypothetical protein
MNLGAEPKKTVFLGGLVLIGGYVFYTNVISTPDAQPRKTAPQAQAPAAPVAPGRGPAPPNIRRTKTAARGAASQDFKPTLKLRPEDRPNYATVDPTLRLDLLAKVQAVTLEGGKRSLFQFGAPPPPKPVEVAAIHPAQRRYGPDPPPKPLPPAVPPAAPPPPPITLKFYGFAKPKPDGQKRAFFMDGDEIFVAAEGELVKKRYRVVQIDVNSVIMEDTEYKNNRQTLVLQQEQV